MKCIAGGQIFILDKSLSYYWERGKRGQTTFLHGFNVRHSSHGKEARIVVQLRLFIILQPIQVVFHFVRLLLVQEIQNSFHQFFKRQYVGD